MKRRLTGLIATLGIAGILVGLPAALLAVGFGPPPQVNDWADLLELLLRRDDGTLALIVLKAVGWITWAVLGVLILVEIGAHLRGIRPRDLPGLHVPQGAARQLVAAAAALFVAIPSAVPAHAEPTAPPVTVTTVASVPAATPSRVAPTSAPVGVEAPVSEAPPATRSYTVKRGESLWSIAAAELGNGRRYREIAALNAVLLDSRGDGFLKPGWILTLPAGEDAPRPVTAQPGDDLTYRVEKGDTLSEIALEHYGDAQAYPRIAAASRHITQPGGHRLTDPDVIDIGWTLTIPGAPGTDTPTEAATPPTEHAERQPDAAAGLPPAAAPSVAPSQGPASATPTPSASPTTITVTDDADEQEVAAPGWLVAGLVGSGTVLGGSLWLALRRRRAAQSRGRRPGRMAPTPAAGLAPVEKTLATAGASAAPTIELVDQALRRLAATRGRAGQPMPAVAAVELSDTALVLHLTHSCDLSAPWESAPDQLHWRLSAAVGLDQVGPLDPAVPAPYPQLVSVGGTDQGHQWLLNLEDSGVLRLTGDPERVADFARYLVAELAVNPWSRDVTVECVGIGGQVVALNPRRVRHHPSAHIAGPVLADTVAMIDRSTQAGLDVATGRASLLQDDLWDSRLLLLANEPDPTAPDSQAIAQLLNVVGEHPRRSGTVVVLAHEAAQPLVGEELRLSAEGRLLLAAVGLDLVGVGLTEEEAAGCAALLAQADQPADAEIPAHSAPADGWRAHTNQAGQLLADHTQARDSEYGNGADSVLAADDEEYLAVAATTAEDLAVLAPRVSLGVRDQVKHDDPTLDDDLHAWLDPHSELPKLRVLGPLTVRVASTGKPSVAAGRKPYFGELLAYLATRPHGATTEELAEAMSITPDRVRKDVLAVRNWLGINPRTGKPHLPDSRSTDAARIRGKNTYQVEGLLVDADLFRRLRARAESRGPDGLDDLRAALDLVTGTPFTQLRRQGGAWLADGDRLDQILQCAIVDVAHLLTIAALQQGDLAAAQQPAELAARVAPADEIPQLDLVSVLEAQGHHRAASQRLREYVLDRTDDEDGTPTEPPARTEQILDHRRRPEPTRTKATA